MKIRTLIVCAVLGAGWLAARATGENAAPAAATEPAEARPAVADELRAIVERTQARLAAGAKTEAELADELKAFDALLASHAGEKTDAVARVLLMKAMLYLQVFEDLDRGAVLLRQTKTDFPLTQLAVRVDEALAQIEEEKRSAALKASLSPGAMFPDFAEKDLAGNPLSIGALKGRIVLVDFWATWCGPCVAELPNVLAAYEKYHAKGFEIIGISLDRSEEALKKFIAEKKMSWPQYFDGKAWDSVLGRQYGVTSIPATYLLDREGRIVGRDLRGADLEAALARLLPE